MQTRLTAMDTPRPATRCEECRWGQCDFTVSRVRFFLHVRRQAQLVGEPFEAVLRHRSRNSRLIDPAIRGNSFFDWTRARAIGWSLDAVARHHATTPGFMHPANAEAVAAELCPERFNEDTR